jgi:hypothetical protein
MKKESKLEQVMREHARRKGENEEEAANNAAKLAERLKNLERAEDPSPERRRGPAGERVSAHEQLQQFQPKPQPERQLSMKEKIEAAGKAREAAAARAGAVEKIRKECATRVEELGKGYDTADLADQRDRIFGECQESLRQVLEDLRAANTPANPKEVKDPSAQTLEERLETDVAKAQIREVANLLGAMPGLLELIEKQQDAAPKDLHVALGAARRGIHFEDLKLNDFKDADLDPAESKDNFAGGWLIRLIN